MPDKSTKIRVSIRGQKPGNHRLAYGVPQPDGSLVEDNGQVHKAGSWFKSRPSVEDKSSEEQ